MAEKEPFLTVSLGPKLGPKAFYSKDDLVKWFNAEQQWWNELWQKLRGHLDPNSSHTPFQQWWSEFRNGLNGQLQTLANEELTEEQIQNCRSRILSLFQTAYDQRGLLCSQHPEAAFVVKTIEEDPAQGAGTLMAVGNIAIGPSQHDPEFWMGLVRGCLFRLNLVKKIPSEKAASDGLIAQWNETFGKLRGDLESLAETTREQNSTHEKQSAEQQSQFETFSASLEKEWAELKTRLETEIAFKTPVKYWERKARSHLIGAWIWGVALAVLSTAIIGLLVWKITPFLDPAVKFDYGHAALIILIAGFGFWVLRIPSRMLLSAVHLRSDAQQRMTMLQTYIALEAEGKMKAETDRTLILDAIFRPITMGLVKEDQTPTSPLETIVNKVTGGN